MGAEEGLVERLLPLPRVPLCCGQDRDGTDRETAGGIRPQIFASVSLQTKHTTAQPLTKQTASFMSTQIGSYVRQTTVFRKLHNA